MSDDNRTVSSGVSRFSGISKSLTSTMTPAEELLWTHLRAGGLEGRKFKRHVPIGPYFIDLLCFTERLAIDLVDAGSSDRENADPQRDEWLRNAGFTVLHVSTDEALNDCRAVLDAIRSHFSTSAKAKKATRKP